MTMADDTINPTPPTVPIGTPPDHQLEDHASTTAKAKAKISDAAHAVSEEASKASATARDSVKQGVARLQQQATDSARNYAQEGKAKASGALAEFAKLMSEAAGSVDERLGDDYGNYARSAAESVAGFANTLDAKDIDELLAEARNFVKKSPAVAIGTAPAIGFVLARLVKSGVDANQDKTA
ncbi:MAG: hypothetical protein ACTHMG_03990 [Sphingomonas sp.]